MTDALSELREFYNHERAAVPGHWTEQTLGRAVAEMERLQAELAWWQAQPTQQCDSKCDYRKNGDPVGCWCGVAAWEAGKPNSLQQKARTE